MKLLFENWRRFEKKVLREENLEPRPRFLNEWGPSGEGMPAVPGIEEPDEIEVEPFTPDPDFEKTSVDSVEQAKQWYEPGGQRHESWMNFLTSRVGEEEATRIYDEDVLPRIHQRLEGVEIYQAGDPRADSNLAAGAGGHYSGASGPEGEILVSDPPWWHGRDFEGWLGGNPRDEGIIGHELGHAVAKTKFPGLNQNDNGRVPAPKEVWVDNLEDFHSVVGQAGTGETYKPMPYGRYDDEDVVKFSTYKTNDSYEKAMGRPFPGTWVQITPPPPPREIDPRGHNREILRKLFPDMPVRYKGGPGKYAGGEEAGSNPQWHVVDGEVITDIYNLGVLDKEKVEDLMSAVPGTDTYFGDRRAPWRPWSGYIPDDLLRALKYYKNPDLTTDEVLKLLKSIVKVDPVQKRKGQEYQPAAKGREVVVEQKEELQSIFENWRKYLNEGIDPEIIEHIRKAIEERIEIPVRKMFLLENSTVLVHLQVDLNEHSNELMPLVHERWESSDELKQIKEMGYDVRLGVAGEGTDASSVPLTRELL